MAVPKRKTSKARQRSRSANWRLTAPGLSPCPRCRELRPSHFVCPGCGHYRGRDVSAAAGDKKKKKKQEKRES